MNISGDFEKDAKNIIKELSKRNHEFMSVSVIFKVDGKEEFRRSFMSIAMPLIIAGVKLGMMDDNELTEEIVDSKEFISDLEKMVNMSLMQEVVECIERKELKNIVNQLAKMTPEGGTQ